MESTLIAVYLGMLQEHHCSVGDILETPELRERFLTETRQVLDNLPERTLLHELLNLRRRSKLPRSRKPV